MSGWKDIERIDVRPGHGAAKVQCKNHWEVQIDLSTGDVLSSTYRRSDLIESLHDGSFFSDAAKLWIFLPNGLILLALCLLALGSGVTIQSASNCATHGKGRVESRRNSD